MNERLDELAARLEERLRKPLPGRSAQARFAPRHAYGRHAGPAPFDARPAAVVAILFPRASDAGDIHLPLTLRPAHMSDHPGQIALPGGMIEPGETEPQCALREAREELGIADAAVRILGRLTPIYVFASNFEVTPFVAVAPELQFRPNADEVSEVLELPLRCLLSPASREEFEVVRGGLRFRAPCVRLGSHRIWGATSMILGELQAVLAEVPGVGQAFLSV